MIFHYKFFQITLGSKYKSHRTHVDLLNPAFAQQTCPHSLRAAWGAFNVVMTSADFFVTSHLSLSAFSLLTLCFRVNVHAVVNIHLTCKLSSFYKKYKNTEEPILVVLKTNKPQSGKWAWAFPLSPFPPMVRIYSKMSLRWFNDTNHITLHTLIRRGPPRQRCSGSSKANGLLWLRWHVIRCS